MTVLDRYITGQANRSIAAVLLSLLSLITLFALFEELDEQEVTYGLYEVLSYIAKTTPRRLDEILVYGIFLGYLIALGRLAETNELTICRTTGMSTTRICMALAPSLILWLAISVVVAEFVAPDSERSAESDKLQATYGDNALDQMGGLWLRTGPLFMHVSAIDENDRLLGVTQYWLDEDDALVETIRASFGTYQPLDQIWILEQGHRTTLSDGAAVTDTFAHWAWENPITPEVLAGQAFLEPPKMSLIALYRQIQFARTQEIGVSEYELAFWSRILKPLTYLGLTLFALAVVMGPLREVGMGLRLTFGIFAGLSFKYLQDLFAPAAIVFNIPALIAILIPIAAYWLIAIYLIRRNA